MQNNNLSHLSQENLSPENTLALCNFIAELSEASSEPQVFKVLSQYLSVLIANDRTSVTLLTADQTQLEIFAINGTEGVLSLGKTIPIDGTFAGQAVRSLRTIAGDVDHSSSQSSALYNAGLRCAMSTPLMVSNECIGTLNCSSKTPKFYTEESVKLFELVARLTSTNVERQRMIIQLGGTVKEYRDYSEQLEVINGSAEQLSKAMRESEVLSIANQALQKLLPAKRSSYALVDEDGECFHVAKLSGKSTHTALRKVPFEGTALGKAYRESRALYEPQLCNSDFLEHVMLHEANLISAWTVPVRCKGKITSFLNVATEVEMAEGERITQILEALAALVGSTLERVQALEQVSYQTNFDSVTGLPNRHRFTVALTRLIKTCHEHPFALLFIDLDRFKTINDAYGHDVGDNLLQLVGERIRRVVRESDMVARLGGDEFVVLQKGADCALFAENTAIRVIESFNKPFEIRDQKVFMGASVGISLAPLHGTVEADLIKFADIAMYQAKACGRNCHMVYSANLSDKVLYQQKLYNALHHAVDNDELRLLYQPQFMNGHVIGVEALLRWYNPELGNVSPRDFIPLAEETRLINKLTHWVINEALKAVSLFRQRLPDLYVAVNISGQDCRTPTEFLAFVEAALKEHELDGSALELEITENVYLNDTEEMTQFFTKLKALDVKLAIDDFGTGFSSLTYLNRIPLDTLKIDQSFVQEIESDVGKRGVVGGIITIANSLDINCLAEGVETAGQQEHLETMGCLRLQGYHLSRPINQAQFQEKYFSPYQAHRI